MRKRSFWVINDVEVLDRTDVFGYLTYPRFVGKIINLSDKERGVVVTKVGYTHGFNKYVVEAPDHVWEQWEQQLKGEGLL